METIKQILSKIPESLELDSIVISSKDGVNAIYSPEKKAIIKELSMFAYNNKEEYGLKEDEFISYKELI